MKLYGSDTSPYVRKGRVVLLEKDIECEWVLERPADPGGRFRELNPLGKVPVLELDSGDVLFDSPVIVEYLDTRSGERLIPETGAPRWQVQKLHALADGILDATVARFLEELRPEDKQQPAVIGKQSEKIHRGLDYLEHLMADQKFAVGDQFSLADIVLVVALEYIDLRYAHDWCSSRPALTDWHATMGERPAFVATRPPRG